MLNITVYGPGCARCKETEQRVRQVVHRIGLDAVVTKATDFAEMARAGVLSTPAVSINGEIKVAGRIPSEEEISAWLK